MRRQSARRKLTKTKRDMKRRWRAMYHHQSSPSGRYVFCKPASPFFAWSWLSNVHQCNLNNVLWWGSTERTLSYKPVSDLLLVFLLRSRNGRRIKMHPRSPWAHTYCSRRISGLLWPFYCVRFDWQFGWASNKSIKRTMNLTHFLEIGLNFLS